MEIIPNGSNDVNQGIEGQCTTKQQKAVWFDVVDDQVGTFISSRNASHGNCRWESYDDAVEDCARAGIVILPREFKDQDLLFAFEAVGCTVRWNEMYRQFEVRDDDKPDEGWVQVSEKGHELRRVVNKIVNRCVLIKVEEEGRGKDKKKWYTLERIVPAKTWGRRGEDHIALFLALRGDKIEDFNPRQEFAVKMAERVDALSPQERAALEYSLNYVFTGLYYLDPKNRVHETLARAAGRTIFAMIAHRALQYHPKYKDRRSRGQSNVPVLVGEAGIGKSNYMNALNHVALPNGGLMPSGAFGLPWTELQRLLSTANLLLFDDIDTVEGRKGKEQVGTIKQIITTPSLTFRDLYAKQFQTVPNPCVLIGTANSLQLPPVEGMRRRFLPFQMVRSAHWAGPEKAVQAGFQWIDDNFEGWLLAGFSLAMRDAQLELTDEEEKARNIAYADVSDDRDEVMDCIVTMIESGDYTSNITGVTMISAYQVAHQLGELKRAVPLHAGHATLNVGSSIDPSETMTSNKDLMLAFTSMGKNHPTKAAIRNAMNNLGIDKKCFVKARNYGDVSRGKLLSRAYVWRIPDDWCISSKESVAFHDDPEPVAASVTRFTQQPPAEESTTVRWDDDDRIDLQDDPAP